MLVDRGLYLFIRYSHALGEWCLGVGRYVTVCGGKSLGEVTVLSCHDWLLRKSLTSLRQKKELI